MGVRPGYKQTEVGVIPEDWEVTYIGAEFTIQLGKMLDSEKNTGIPKPYVGNRAVQWGWVDVSNLEFMKMTPSDLQRFRLRNGDLLVCEGGEIGRCAIWNETLDECYYQKALHRLRPKSGYNVTFMLNVLRLLASNGFLLNFVTQTSIAHLPKEKLELVPIPLPPTKAEQQAIAEALSDADALIESLEQLLAKKRLLKQGAMQELLTGKRRLPGFEVKSGYKQTEVGAVPEDWKIIALGELGMWKSGGTPSMQNPFFWEKGTISWVTSGDVKRSLLSESPMKITTYAVKNSSTTLLPINSIIIVTRSGILRKYLPVAKNIRQLAINQDLKALIPNDDHVADYLLHMLVWSGPNILATCLKSGTTVESIEYRWLKSLTVPLPPTKTEQDAIAVILNNMDSEIDTLETKLAKTRQLKQGMMQELLTGRIRLI